ncbi:pentapeptide repeat-containing protein [Qipengyuania sp. R86523]|uniref:pentapeptide repeat-containing protein n=1 Tax=Qipengyuania sp. R86523 TaxID=3093862 RepID=UPI0037CB8F40
MADEFDKVLEIAKSDTHDLVELARLSGREIRSFFNSADLRGCDLSGQSLVGLNFDWADLRGTSLRESEISEGALNNAIVDQEFDFFQDEFDSYLSDIDFPQLHKLAVFGRFRPGLFEDLSKAIGSTYKETSKVLGVGTSTLRRMRLGEPVSTETLEIVKDSLDDFLSSSLGSSDQREVFERLLQPSISFGQYLSERFMPINRSDILSSFEIVDKINEVVRTRYRDKSGYFNWSIKPKNLLPFLQFYREIGFSNHDISPDANLHYPDLKIPMLPFDGDG